MLVNVEHAERAAIRATWSRNLEGDRQEFYDELHCGGGRMENRIKEQHPELFADQTSCTK